MSTAGDSRSRLPFFLFAAVACIIVIAGAWFRGGWLDEFATFRFADPAVPFRTAWRDLWPTETNPPFFYMIARAGVRWLGASLFARRMINLAPLLFLLAWFATAWARHPQHRAFLAGFALFGFSSKFFLFYFPEYRSYFWQFAAELVFVGAACIGWLERRRSVDPFELAALPFLILLHQVTALYASVLIALLFITDVRRGFHVRAMALAVVTAVSFVPLALFTLHQLHAATHVQGLVSWIHPLSAPAAIVFIGARLPPDFAQNWIAFAAICAALLIPAWRPRGDAANLIGLLAAAATISTVAVLIINHWIPLSEERYFSFLVVELAAIAILALLPLVLAKHWLAALIFLNAAIYLSASGWQLMRDQRWNRGAAMVAALVARCPQTRVHAGSLPINAAEQIGLAYISAPRHLHLLPMRPDEPGRCPVIYWTEYKPASRIELAMFHGDAVRATNYRAGFNLPPEALVRTNAIRTQNGMILLEK